MNGRSSEVRNIGQLVLRYGDYIGIARLTIPPSFVNTIDSNAFLHFLNL